MPGFKLNTFDFSSPASEVTGKVTGVIFANSKIVKPYNLNLNAYKMDGVLNGGYIKRRVSGEGSLEKILSRMEIEGLSPIEFQTADLIPGKGIYAKGKIKSTVKLIEKLDIDITIMGDDIEISKTFSSGEITSVPPPFKINDASVTIFAGTSGIGVRGAVDFEIANVGKGQVKGSGKSNGVFELEGKFEFDKKIFDKAEVEMKYRHASGEEDQWEVKGKIQIPKGKIKGVKKADITVSYDGKTLAASGTAEFDIPGIKSGKLDVTYTEDQLNIHGEIDLQHQLIKSGKIKADVSKTGEEYKVALSGNVQPNIPGISTELKVDYVDGILTISGSVGYNKGRLAGTVTVGVTNRSVGADGNPAGGPSEALTPFGGGSLTLKITDWLQGTAGVKLLPDGSLEVVGKIGIPAAVNIFEKKEIKKDIFKAPTIEIPIFAIPVGSRSIGLVATIGGGLEGYASIGPGQLTDASVEVTYNPSHEENTKVTGTAKFRVPAEAGLRLYVRAGIGLSVGIARVAGGIEIAGALGIEGAAEAGVTVNWSPTEGFKLDAEASLSVQPKFKFDVNAYIEAVLDLWVTEFSKEWKWNLYSFEWGPSFKFGVKFPVHYEEGKEFNISLDDVQFEKPDISVSDIAKGIGEKLLG
jgi:HSP20 family molecular chaperone IbpA